MRYISIIVPTNNEAGSIKPLIERIFTVLQRESIHAEIIVVDDGSTEGTRDKVTEISKQYPVLLVCSNNEDGLANAVIKSAQTAENEIVVVMDGDLSHTPEDIPILVDLLLKEKCDIVIGSRYTPGGEAPEWPLQRKIASKCASFPAQLLTGVDDPLSGFFAVKRARLRAVRPDRPGYKICLELLLGQKEQMNVREIPISFRHRHSGNSKMSMAVITSYLLQLLTLCGISAPPGIYRFYAILLCVGFVADILTYAFCTSLGGAVFLAHLAAVLGSVTAIVLAGRVVHAGERFPPPSFRPLAAAFWIFLLLLFRAGVFVFAQDSLWNQTGVWFPALAATTISTLVIALVFTNILPLSRGSILNMGMRRRLALIGVIVASLLLRILYAGSFELLMEEAYYWNYAQHPDIGYLDHPPMVAVLIKIGTILFGNSEFAIRSGALFCWCIATMFVYLYTRDISTRDNALRAATIMSVLPAFFIFGFFMTPDSPLIACWAGAIFFAQRAFISHDTKRYWLGLGVFLGLGLFSKYTMALFGPALVTFLIIDPSSRPWLLKPQPYIAATIALLILSPVIYWNIDNGWSSFLFQTQNRLQSSPEFSFHELLLFILMLLSPVGLCAGLSVVFCRKPFTSARALTRRQYIFALTLLMVPLAIFSTFSLSKEVKLNWTSPLWLSIMPFMAMTLSRTSTIFSEHTRIRFITAWQGTIIFFLLAYGATFLHFAVGIPTIPYPGSGPLFGWKEFAVQIDTVVESIEKETGKRPAVVGMDLYKTASGLAFYRTINFENRNDPGQNHPLTDTVGRNMLDRLGRTALMYGYWFSPADFEGVPMLALSLRSQYLEQKWMNDNAQHIGEINELHTTKNGHQVGPLYYRLVNIEE